jgi:hypothetical protein
VRRYFTTNTTLLRHNFFFLVDLLFFAQHCLGEECLGTLLRHKVVVEILPALTQEDCEEMFVGVSGDVLERLRHAIARYFTTTKVTELSTKLTKPGTLVD